jgi:hypothetical protein
MKWPYKVCLLLLALSQIVFFSLAAYHTDDQIYRPEANDQSKSTRGYSWIWYHPEQWLISLALVVAAIVFFVFAAGLDIKEFGRKKA